MENKIHKTTLRLEIDKTVQPKQFEPIKIQVSVEEDFYWEDEKDRYNKMKELRDRMSDDFVICFNEVMTKIGEKDRCIGTITTNKKNASKNNTVKDEEVDFDFD